MTDPRQQAPGKDERELQVSFDWVQFIIKHNPSAIAVFDNDLRYLLVSDRYLKDYHVKEEDIIGKLHYDVFPEMPERWKEVHRRVLAGAVEANDDDYFDRPDGSKTYNRWECRPWYRADGSIGGMLTYTEVTTERKRAEIALSRSESRFREFFDKMSTGAAIYEAVDDGTDFVFVDFNHAGEDICQARRADVLGRRLSEAFPGAAGTGILDALRRVWLTGASEALPPTHYVDGDRSFWATNSVFKLPSGEVVAVFEDVGQRLRAEAALEEKTRELDRYFSSSLDLLCIADTRLVLRRLNPQWEKTLGYSLDQLVGHPLLDLVHPEDLETTRQALAEIAAGREVLDFVNRCRCADGTYRWMDWRCSFAGELIYGTARDITEGRKLEEQLRQAQKLESIGRLAGGVAHDFNNLLTVINGYSAILMSGLAYEDPLWGNAEQIHKAGARAASLTEQLLAFSRKQVIRPRPINLNEIATDIEKMLTRLLGEDIELELRLEPALGVVGADRDQLCQVLVNLALNARDAMPSGGKLTISTANVEVGDAAVAGNPDATPGDAVRLCVSDAGSGMDEETREHIFEPFFTTKAEGKGTGLGLATVYGIVRQAGGWISVDSAPGRGSSFEIYIPRIGTRPEPDRHPDDAPTNVSGGETVLVVEDQDEVRTLTTAILHAHGYRTLAAASGAEALDIARRHAGPIELLLTDVVLPGMNGRELALELERLRPGIGVLFMSGYTRDVIAHRGVLDEGVSYLPKPFTAEALVTKVRGVLDRSG